MFSLADMTGAGDLLLCGVVAAVILGAAGKMTDTRSLLLCGVWRPPSWALQVR